jgi:poly-gamma-glutamate synthesis protein (capsule biosynthesis protein)
MIGRRQWMTATGAATLAAAAPKLGRARAEGRITLFLCGDVMTGRGIDQVLPHPSDPRLYEGYVKSATGYVSLAESKNGPIPKPVDFAYIWGAAIPELARRLPDVRIINLETSITKQDEPAPKGINYRMNPENIGCIAAAGIDCCVLANNHVLDWGRAGCVDTWESLHRVGITTAGAGRDARQAASPAILPAEHGRVLVFAFGSITSGIPPDWAATATRPGVNFLSDLSPGSADRIARQVRATRRDNDIVVASIHWGGNWGYGIPSDQRDFAHRLIEQAGVDIVHGHSSHHLKGIEIYQGKPILYGCGDFINDYEGIDGYDEYRGDLALMYFPTIDVTTRRLVRLDMKPLRLKRFQLHRASKNDAEWLCATLVREGRKLGTTATLSTDNTLSVAPIS